MKFTNQNVYEVIKKYISNTKQKIGNVEGVFFMVIITISNNVYSAPILFKEPFHQTPSMAVPGLPFLINGDGFSEGDQLVYRVIDNESDSLTPPRRLPIKSDENFGFVNIISHNDIKSSITARWPLHMKKDKAYSIWVVDKNQQWSNGIKVNDVRPLWVSPSFIYQTQGIGSLERYLKVIGRNFHPVTDAKVKVKLVDIVDRSNTLILTAENDQMKETMIENYVAKVLLPGTLKQGKYEVWVSKDDYNWVYLRDQTFQVLSDPDVVEQINIKDYGCLPNDSKDDAYCIEKAISYFNTKDKKLRGSIIFDEGNWDLLSQNSSEERHSIILPVGVNLIGKGSNKTTISRNKITIKGKINSWFILSGNNTVKGIKFYDTRHNDYLRDAESVFQIGELNRPEEDSIVKNIIIDGNVFDKPYRAIVDAGINIERLFIINNLFGVYDNAIYLDGYKNKLNAPFIISDSVIVNNIFNPGSFINVDSRRGTIASQIGASKRLDFSSNFADGASLKFLSRPSEDAKGWRAAFFWHLRHNQEMVLVSNNKATCTGDKTGDGESFAFDNNHNSVGFISARQVISVRDNTIVVKGELNKKHEGKLITPDYFKEHWIQIVNGKGNGQIRKIESYKEGLDQVTITVSPAWDVQPDLSSKVTMGLEFWQLMVIDNFVDNRAPLCLKSNRRIKKNSPYGAGAISLWAQAADTVIAGNTQYHSDGIVLHPFYSAPGQGCPQCSSETMFQHNIEVKNNRIIGEYDWSTDCSRSGITVSYGSSPTDTPSPILSHGISITDNKVVKADGFSGGAISIVPSWWEGSKLNPMPLINNTIISRNTIVGINESYMSKECNRGIKNRTLINLSSKRINQTLLDSNVCEKSNGIFIVDNATKTVFSRIEINKTYCESLFLK